MVVYTEVRVQQGVNWSFIQ